MILNVNDCLYPFFPVLVAVHGSFFVGKLLLFGAFWFQSSGIIAQKICVSPCLLFEYARILCRQFSCFRRFSNLPISGGKIM